MKRISLSIGCLLLALAPSAHGQGVPERLTLAEALRIARAHNPQLQQVRNDADVSAARERSAWAGFLPRLSASMGVSGNSSRRVTGEDPYGQPIERPEPISFQGSSSSQSISAQATLFDGFRTLNEARAAGAETRASVARAEARAVEVEARVARLFYDALERERLIALEERVLASYGERLEATEARLRVAAADPVDVLGARVDVARQEQQVEAARGEARKARLTLLRDGMGVAGAADFEPVGEPAAPFDPAGLEAEALIEAALRTSPQVAEQAALLKAAGHAARVARGTRWPEITGSASFSRGMELRSYSALTELNPRNSYFRFGLSATLPVFSQFRTSAEVVRATAASEDAEHALRAARLAVDREVRSALIDLRNAYRAVELAERSATLSRERVELAQEKYRLGAFDFTQLQLLSEQAAQAERRAVQARFGFARALVALEERVGTVVRP